jgi:hypothetical protein
VIRASLVAHAAKRVTAQRPIGGGKVEIDFHFRKRGSAAVNASFTASSRRCAHTGTRDRATRHALQPCRGRRGLRCQPLNDPALDQSRSGQWRIEAGEFHRVYAPSASNGTHSNKTRDRATATLIEAQHRADLAEQRLSDLKNMLADATARRPWWQWRRAG